MTVRNIPSRRLGSNSQSIRDLETTTAEQFFLYLYNELPHVIRVTGLTNKAFEFLNDTKRFDLIASNKDYAQLGKDREDDYFDDENVFVYLDKTATAPTLIKFWFRTPTKYFAALASKNLEHLEKFNKEFEKFISKEEKGEVKFGILAARNGDIYVREESLDDNYSKSIDLGLNYGADFVAHHKKITDRLSNKRHGIFIFHGTPGSGKTTYIKHLAHAFSNKRKFVFIPTTFIDSLVSPNIIPVLLENKDSVLVLEDAEKAVVARENKEGNESLASSLLNIGDGILGSMLNLSIIVTFNTGKDNIDKALLRKGRLMYEHNFDLLSPDDAQKLLDKLGKDYKATHRMSLADIYNLEVETNHKEVEQRKIGFFQ